MPVQTLLPPFWPGPAVRGRADEGPGAGAGQHPQADCSILPFPASPPPGGPCHQYSLSVPPQLPRQPLAQPSRCPPPEVLLRAKRLAANKSVFDQHLFPKQNPGWRRKSREGGGAGAVTISEPRDAHSCQTMVSGLPIHRPTENPLPNAMFIMEANEWKGCR